MYLKKKKNKEAISKWRLPNRTLTTFNNGYLGSLVDEERS